MTDPIIDVLDQEWQAIADLTADLDETAWRTPTALPGWSVQDNISHIIGTELMLAGEPAPDVDVSHLTYLTGPFPAAMEPWIEARRSTSGAAVREEFVQVCAQRLAALRAMSAEELEKVGWSPIGEVPYRQFMRVRAFDCWMHEQDIRRALDRPGHLEGAPVEVTLERFTSALGFIVGKRAAAPDGASVVFHVEGPGTTTRTFAVVVDGKATVVDVAPAAPTTTITLPLTSYIALGGGRWTRAEAEAAGGLSVAGDTDLGARVLDGMAFTP